MYQHGSESKWNAKERPLRGRSFMFVLPISRILSVLLLTLCNHVSGRSVTSTLKRHSCITTSTVLHTRKDLAVSSVCCHTHHPYCYGALSFRARRLCSHLYDYSRRALPATLPKIFWYVFGLSSLISYL